MAADQVLKVKDDLGNPHDLAEELLDGKWGIRTKGEITNFPDEYPISQTQLDQLSTETTLAAILTKIDVIVSNEAPNGVINGSNTNYITFFNFKPGSTKVVLNGLRQREGLGFDYVETGGDQIVFQAAPLLGDIINIDYYKA